MKLTFAGPPGLPSGRMLEFYAREFQTVEINNSFYRLPSGDTLRHWADATPPGFVFAFKGSSYLTHRKKLIDNDERAHAVDNARELKSLLGR